MYVRLLLLIAFQVVAVQPARILVAATTVYPSHHFFFRPIWRELALRGHEVVHLTAFPAHANITNLREIDLSFSTHLKPTAIRDSSIVFQIEQFFDAMLEIIDIQFASKDVQELIHNTSEHFDLVISEIITPPLYVFKKRFNCPLILASSMDIFNIFHYIEGNPIHALLYSQFKVITTEMNFFERLIAFVNAILEFGIKDYSKQTDDFVRKYFGENYPSINEIITEMDLVLLNANILIHQVRPLSPAFITIGGGLHIEEAKKLPKDLKTILDNSKHGVIYFTFGTYVGEHSLSQSDIDMFLATLAELKYDVLLIFPNTDAFSNKTNNVHIRKWVPQQDVLRHKNVKLFITQGGLHSLEEAIIMQIPTIIIPYVADQHANAARMHEQRLAVQMPFSTVTTETLKNMIEKVIGDQQLKQNLKKAASIIQDTPMKPLDKAIWWIEYVIRHKGSQHLRARTLPLWKFYYLDTISFIISMVVIFIFMLRKLKRCIKRMKPVLSDKRKNK